MPDFNINSIVRVKLTELGHTLLKADHEVFWKHYNRSIPYVAPKEDSGGWSEWQLVHFMQLLGGHMRTCSDNIIETNIQFEPFEDNTLPLNIKTYNLS
jgi:hypothetical protein